MALTAFLIGSGCAKMPRYAVGGAPSVAMLPQACEGLAMRDDSRPSANLRQDRKIVWTARITLEVWNISNAVAEVANSAQRLGGFVEGKSDGGEGSASLTLRVPAKDFAASLTNLESLGSVLYRNVQSEDVTEQHIDVEALLANKLILRNRLKQLLEKATEVKDILAIETELNRVQSDIDSMDGQLKSLNGQIEFSTITLYLQQKPILGPLGYIFKGLWWGIEKLFVIRD